ncbi:ACT domain-containing protein ACR8-like [Impatiens glandulifera]|uniref:ACT domain-containing protein ACR8-like n=1 Tax=Impatiens glandulifera TaxID=253017 RepID=UPI001FB0B6FA|nr:ACT domain-containing protein ACR8-like [Impatiens glandulifera]
MDNDIRSTKTSISIADIHTERRLNQMMFSDRDYEREPIMKVNSNPSIVNVENCLEKGYSVVHIEYKDRTKLLFDVVCTLIDMQYVVYHGTINTNDGIAFMELFIKYVDGNPINSKAEKQRVVLCIKAAIERRGSEGVRLELCKKDKKGLLADVTRTFRENGLNTKERTFSLLGWGFAGGGTIVDVEGEAAAGAGGGTVAVYGELQL